MLTNGVRDQVQKLVDALTTDRELQNIRVHLADKSRDSGNTHSVLEPFRSLENLSKSGEFVIDGLNSNPYCKDLISDVVYQSRRCI